MTLIQKKGLSFKEKLSLCTRCGKCLSVCPSYEIYLKESFSPRGRNFLLNNSFFSSSFEFCLFCERCANACPHKISFPEAFLEYKFVSKSKKKLKALVGSPLAQFLSLAKNFALKKKKNVLQKATKNQREEKKKVKVFVSCGLLFLYPRALKKFTEFLEKKGIEVEEIYGECCGAPFLNLGLLEEFEKCAKKNLKILKNIEEIVFFCATCMWIFKKVYPLFFKKTQFEEEALKISQKVVSAISYLENFRDLKIFQKNVLFHKPCHLTENLNLVKNKEEGNFCCGSLKLSLWLVRFQEKYKKKWIKNLETKKYLATFCTGCYLNFKFLLKEPPKVCHWLELIE